MCAEKYLSNNKSALFSVEDDVDDDEFLRRSTKTGGHNQPASQASSSDYQRFEGKRMELLQQQKETEQRSVEATQRSLSLLRNSEQIGIATAEELMKQREQLERTDKRLDDINVMLRASHRHIEGIKSVFGSFKNYLRGKQDAPPTPEKPFTCETERTPSSLSQTLSASASASNFTQDDHPGLRVRGIGSDDELRNRPENPRQVIDENLDEMVNSLSRLKGLARGLGEEIESQNDLIDKILPKVDRSDITLERQNKDMKRLLK